MCCEAARRVGQGSKGMRGKVGRLFEAQIPNPNKKDNRKLPIKLTVGYLKCYLTNQSARIHGSHALLPARTL